MFPAIVCSNQVAGAGDGVPSPVSFGGAGLAGVSGKAVPAGAPSNGPGLAGGLGGGVKLPVRTMSSTCVPSSVSNSYNALAMISSLSR